MKTFNKTLLAAFVAASASGTAMAQSVSYAGATENGCEAPATCAAVSAQGLATSTGIVDFAANTIDVEFTSAADAVDRIIIRSNGAPFTLTAPQAITGGAGISFAGAGTSGNETVTSVQLSDLNTLVIDIEDDDGNGNVTAVDMSGDVTVSIPNVLFDAGELTSGDEISVSAEAQAVLANQSISLSSVSGIVAEVVNQFEVETQVESVETINAQNRLSWTDGTTETSFEFDVIENSVDFLAATVQGNNTPVTFVVEGDFAFLDSDGDGEIDSGNTVLAGADTIEFAEDFSSFEIVKSGAAFPVSFDVDFEFDGEREIPAQELEGNASFAYSESGTVLGNFSDSDDVIDWTLQGTQQVFRYMPYGDNISQILFVTNNGRNAGAISVTATDEDGNVYGPVTLDKVAEAGAVTKITGEVKEALIAEGFSGQGALQLILNVNASNVSYYGAYNVGGSDRGYVPAGL